MRRDLRTVAKELSLLGSLQEAGLQPVPWAENGQETPRSAL